METDQLVPPPMTFTLQTRMEMLAPFDLGYYIRLVGEAASLDALDARLRSDEHRIVVFEGSYFLVSDRLHPGVMHWDYKRIADEVVERINALGKLALDNYKSVGFDAIIWNQADGRRWMTFQSQGFAYPGPVVARSGERQGGSPTFEELCLALLPAHPKVDEALRLYGRENHDWITLYRLFEIIQHEVGGSLAHRGWASKTEIARFSATSQHPEIVGSESRHGHTPNPPIKNPMNLTEARDFIRGLLDAWFRELHKAL